jgi:hypothetical protein
MNEHIRKLFGRLFIVRRLVYFIAGTFGAGFVYRQATYVEGG